MNARQANPGFSLGHATHYDWRMACELALAQVEPWFKQHQHLGGVDEQSNPDRRWIGWLYFTAAFASEAKSILEHVMERTGIRHWVGCCAESVLAGAAEYNDEAAMALMIGTLPSGSFEVFSGRRKATRPSAATTVPSASPTTAASASASASAAPTSTSASRSAAAAAADGKPQTRLLVHADPQLSDLSELLDELSLRHDEALCFGGVCSGLEGDLPQVADEVLFGGLSGLVLTQSAGIRSSFSQGCLAIGSRHQITVGERHLVRRIDDRPAMDVLLQELGISQDPKGLARGSSVLDAIPQQKLQGGLLVEIADPHRNNQHGYVRNLLGIDPSNGTIAIAGQAKAGWSLRFCTRDPQAARADLIASCTALRESIEEAGQKLLAVIYISCLARGQHLFGQAGLEGQWVQHYLQAPVMIGFQANGEIHQNQLHGYSAVTLAICD